MPPDASEIWPPPPRRRVYLMRHGDIAYFDEPGRPYHPETVPLTAAGCRQADEAGLALKDAAFDAVITSGLRRTDETARRVLGKETALVCEPRFREIQTGRMTEWGAGTEALVRQAILGALPVNVTCDMRFLAGEAFGACQDRVLAAWRDLLARPGWKSVLVVSHGVVNRLLLGHCLDMPLGALARLEQDAGCINLIEVDAAGVPLVRALNFTAHNPCKQGMTLSTLEGLYQQYLQGRTPPRQG